MARTTEMRLIEMMILKEDISNVVEYLGHSGEFQLQSKHCADTSSAHGVDPAKADGAFFDALQKARAFLALPDREEGRLTCPAAKEEDRENASAVLAAVDSLSKRFEAQTEETNRVRDAYKEALAFSNLQISYSELESLSFLSLKIGKIPPENIPSLKAALGGHAVVVPLGDDDSRILAASTKKGRFALDTELKKSGFVGMEVPKDFKGIPSDVLFTLEKEKNEEEKKLAELDEERKSYAETHRDLMYRLLGAFAVSVQIAAVEASLEATAMVYRLTGWVPAYGSRAFIKHLDSLTEGRIAIREYLPTEVPAVLSGEETVPVKLKHGKFVQSFERMIFSYGAPVYGAIDPTPFVAVFFTILFGVMFGDLGQGLIFLLAGILMAKKVIKVGGWNKFAPIFIAIGIASSVMGLVTGEFFSNETVLEPFAHFVTGLFGKPRAPIVKMMPSSDPHSIKVMFHVFGIAVAIGFIINSAGLLINLLNKAGKKHWGAFFFGKTGLAGAIFFWYSVAFAIRIAAFSHRPAFYDWIIIGVTLFFAAFAHPFERLIDGKRPVMENGFGALFITGLVELIEVISNYMSNTVSFLRVGAFALAHAVLGYIINTMTQMCGGAAGLGILVLIAGNAVVVVLEGMIVAIQVIRLQYYEFFSKFFNETGTEFVPLTFYYGNKI